VKQIRARLTYANVMSSIAVFLVLGGATAFAATQLGKNTVGTKQLKKNAVTAAKIKKGAVNGAKLADGSVTEAKLGPDAVTEGKLKGGAVTAGKLADNSVGAGKLQNGAVTGEKIAAGAVTGANINPGSMPFSQITARLRTPSSLNLQTPGATFLGQYVQSPNEDDVFLAGGDVTFDAGCVQPRSAAVYLLLNSPEPNPENLIGLGVVTDKSVGTVTRRIDIGEFPAPGSGGMKRMGGGSAQTHTFFLYIASGSCSSGSGITGSNLGVDVLGTK
jgi:hypothetical protein